MYYSTEKRNKCDRCNICGKLSNLTWDHIPPKFNRNNLKTNYRIPFTLNGNGTQLREYYISQNGIRFRSLCSECNNTLLGSSYDITYNKYLTAIEKVIFAGGIIPQYILVEIEINRLCRAIVGHLLAAKNSFDICKIDLELRKYFLDQTLLPPKGFHLQQLFYPHNSIFIVRDATLIYDENHKEFFPHGLVSCLSSSPFSFIISQDEATIGLLDLFSHCSTDINEKCIIDFDMLSCFYNGTLILRSPQWPCNIDMKYGVYGILGGSAMTDAIFALK